MDSPPPLPQSESAAIPWLVRIDEIFGPIAEDILQRLGAQSCSKLGREYYLIKVPAPIDCNTLEAGKFVRWNLPVQHSWPCNPQRMKGFIEKAAQTILKKFGASHPQSILVGQLHPGATDDYFKSLASNLRGRLLQIMPPQPVSVVEEQEAGTPTLYCLVGKNGLFCGMHSPRAANGFYPGGSRFVSLSQPGTISRAGGKIAEALHYLKLYRPALAEQSHWLELGACPGGMTSELLTRGFKVTAIDWAPLDQRLDHHENLHFILSDVGLYEPKEGEVFDALLCDMNGSPYDALEQMLRLSAFLKPGALVIFTLKFARVERAQDPLALFRNVVERAAEGGLKLVARTHLTYNGFEFTLFFET